MDKELQDRLVEELKNSLGVKGEGQEEIDFEGIAKAYTDFLAAYVPKNVAVLFAFARRRDKIMCVIGGQHADSSTYDSMLTKLGAQIDSRRDFDCTSQEMEIERKG